RLTQPLKSFALLPEKIYDFEDPIYPKWEGDERIGMAFNQKSESFGPSLFALTASYVMEGEKWRIELQDFKNDSIYHFWELGQKEVSLSFLGGSFVHMPIMMADSGLLVFFHGSNKLLRIDKNSQVIWRNEEFVFHHAMNLDTEGMLWICGFENRGLYNPGTKQTATYLDDVLLKIDAESGKVLQKISVGDVLIKEGYKELVFGFSNTPGQKTGDDPFHNNDIQPVHFSSAYWEKGDLFISLKHRSAILHIRPSTVELLHLIQGPFNNQHDVDILSDTEIAFFHNNFSFLGDPSISIDEDAKRDTMGLSEILVYNFQEARFYPLLDAHFKKEQIFSASQGQFERLPSGRIFVESQNQGILYLFSKKELLMKKTLPATRQGYIGKPHWIRVFEEEEKFP
ncbi:MAG: arylsulfotransferase family protein, partial [Bacteroidota bacterium]